MPKSKPVTGSNLKRVDAHVIQPEEYDDTPEITDEMLERADLYDGDKLIRPGKGGPNPRVAQAIRRTAGRPRLANPRRSSSGSTPRWWSISVRPGQAGRPASTKRCA
jgi:hypothetical protein